jgi:hypothetical protein
MPWQTRQMVLILAALVPGRRGRRQHPERRLKRV